MQVRDIMTPRPACCTSETSLQEVAQMMVDHDCGCIPVVDGDGSNMPIGMITDRDICCRVVAQGKNPLDLTAGDAMTASVVSVKPETDLHECENLMEESQVRRIAVVDDKGAVCGIVSLADIAINAPPDETAEVVQEVSKATA